MTLSPRTRTLVAVGLVAALLTAAIPIATSDDTPDLSTVTGKRLEGASCLSIELAPSYVEDLQARLAALADDPEAEVANRTSGNATVPVLCGQHAEAVFGELIGAGNAALATLGTSLEAVIDRYHEERPDRTLPFLADDFSNERLGGLGEWQLRAGSGMGFRDPIDGSVTDGYALTDTPEGTYEHALNATIVSPAIDLGGVATSREVTELPNQMLALLEQRLPARAPLSRTESGDGSTFDICVADPRGFFGAGGEDQCAIATTASALGETYLAVRAAYLEAAGDLLRTYAEEVSAVTLDLHHQFNLARGLDGVRVEVLTKDPVGVGLPPSGVPIEPRSDSARRGYGEVGAFNGREGFTGDSHGWLHERFDLSAWAGQRIWLVIRAQTAPNLGIPNFFDDRTLFENRTDYGYALGGLWVNGTAHEHNLRVLEVDAGQVHIAGRDRAPRPSSDRPIEIAVTNQGLTAAEADLRLKQCQDPGCQGALVVDDVAYVTDQPICDRCPGIDLATLSLAPGEVTVLKARYVKQPLDKGRIVLQAELEHTGDQPEATPDDNVATASFFLSTVRQLDVRPAPGGSLGLTLTPGTGGVQDPRTVRMTIVNSGNVPVDDVIRLRVTDTGSGAEEPSFVKDGEARAISLDVRGSQTLSWTLVPGKAGIFKVTAMTERTELKVFPKPAVHLFIERSPGVACADDVDRVRVCGELWSTVTDLPQEGDWLAAARARDGTLYALDPTGVVQRFEPTGWAPLVTDGKQTTARWLVGGSDEVLAFDADGTTYRLDAAGLERGSRVPLDGLDAVTVDPRGNAVIAGSWNGTIAVVVGDGRVWRVFSSPAEQISRGSIRIAGVTTLEDGTPVLALVTEHETIDRAATVVDEASAYVQVCIVTPGIDDQAIGCVTDKSGSSQLVRIPPGLSAVEIETDTCDPDVEDCDILYTGRRPAVSIAAVGNWTVLLVESPRVANTNQAPGTEPGYRAAKGSCERVLAERTIAPGTPDHGPFRNDHCAYRLRIDPLDPFLFESFDPVPDDPANVLTTAPTRGDHEVARVASAGDVAWLIDRAPVRRDIGPPDNEREVEFPPVHQLYRFVLADNDRPTAERASVPGPRALRTVTPGDGAPLGLTNGTVLGLTGMLDHLDNGGDWETGQALVAQTNGAVWTTVMDRDLKGAAFAKHEPAPERRYLRGLCNTNGAHACFETTARERPEDVELTLRYNLRNLAGQHPEVRLLLAGIKPPHQAVGKPGGGDGEIDLEGPQGASAIAAGAYITLEQELNQRFQGLGGGSDDEGTIRGSLDESDTVKRITGGTDQRSPHVWVHSLSRTTGAAWQEVTIDLKDVLKPYVLVHEQVSVAGVELYFPRGTEMAVDALWLNVTWGAPGSDQTTRTQLATWGSQAHSVGEWSSFGSSERPDSRPAAYVNNADGARADKLVVDHVWRQSTVTRQPAWAFMGPDHNDQGWADHSWNGHIGVAGAQGKLSCCGSTFDRLATPVIDLREASHPILTFDHGYAFLFHSDTSKSVRSAGWVEAQFETSPGKWSQWFKLRPEGGYPVIKAPGGDVPADAYVGTTVGPDRDRGRSALLDPATWETATFDLINQTQPLAGERVRLGFVGYLQVPSATGERNWEQYEGWVFSDLRVSTEQRLARDLALVDVRFDEAYDVLATGLPPGGTVRLNATLHNSGLQESQGGLARWELVAVGAQDKVVARGATPLASIQPGRTTYLELPVRVPAHAVVDGIAIEDTLVYVRMSLDAGAEPDEDPSNDVALVGSRAKPIAIGETRDLRVLLDVTPPDSSPQRVRAVEVRLENLGNVPLTGIDVQRTIEVDRGVLGRLAVTGQTFHYTTTKELPPGAIRSLSTLVDDFDQASRFWTPGTDGSYTVRALASGPDLRDMTEVGAVALDPYLEASVEDPVQGLTASGDFHLGEGWIVANEGVFGEGRSYAIDVRAVEIGEDGRTMVLELPQVDLSVARGAKASFFHKYAFEHGFDGGRLEVSLDDGETWHVVPSMGTDKHRSYGEILGGNPLADGNLTTPAFTGNSSAAGVDGWVLSTFNLGLLPGFTEPGELEAFDLENLAGSGTRPVPAPPAKDGPATVYTHPTWNRGSIAASRAFLVENATAHVSDAGEEGFLYTGPARAVQKFGTNIGARLEVNLPSAEERRKVVLSWREWAPINQDPTEVADTSWPGDPYRPVQMRDHGLTIDDLYWNRGIYAEPPATVRPAPNELVCHENRFLVKLTRVDGYWRHYEVDVTPAIRAGETTVTLDFTWAPWLGGKFRLNYPDHPGVVVDDVALRSYIDHASGEIDRRTQALSTSSFNAYSFDAGTAAAPTPCAARDEGTISSERGLFKQATTGDIKAPAATWHIVDVSELAKDRPIYQGRERIFSSSPMVEGREGVFDGRAADTRLVLPALDLTAAGDDVRLDFEHVPAFQWTLGEQGGGGVVEVSVWDPGTGEWQGWEQLYAKPKQLNDFELMPNPSDGTKRVYRHNVSGGYGAYIQAVGELPKLNATSQAELALGNTLFATVPFDTFPGDPQQRNIGKWGPGRHADNPAMSRVAYVYNQCAAIGQARYMELGTTGAGVNNGRQCDSVTVGAANNVDLRWWNASYNLSEFAGERIRIAFHAYHTGACSYQRGYEPHAEAANPNEKIGDALADRPIVQSYKKSCPDDGARWLVDNVFINALAFAGDDVRMRLVAGFDGSVHDATWMVDSIEVQGTAYRNNVGLYLDHQKDHDPDDPVEVLEMAAGSTTTIRGELRNLGTQLRRGIAVEATIEGTPVKATLTIPGIGTSQGVSSVTSKAVSLGPGASRDIFVNLTPREDTVTEGLVNVTLKVVTFNDVLGTFAAPTGEEVRSNLVREVPLEIRPPTIEIDDVWATPNRVESGATVQLTTILKNRSPQAAAIELRCVVQRVDGWRAVNHASEGQVEESPRLGVTVPCAALGKTVLDLAPGKTRVVFEAAPERAGAYLVEIQLVDRSINRQIDAFETRFWSGNTTVRLHESFESFFQPGWSETRRGSARPAGDRGGFSGANAGGTVFTEQFDGNGSYRMNYQRAAGSQLRTPPIDLHNVTDGGAALTFYHLARFARGDGADVTVRVLQQEGNPGTDSSWTPWCKLDPVGGYPGYVASFHLNQADDLPSSNSPEQRAARAQQGDTDDPTTQDPRQTPSPDYNNALRLNYERDPTGIYRLAGFYGTTFDPALGEVPRWDDAWGLAQFPLGFYPGNETAVRCDGNRLLGRTVQFAFTLFTGESDDAEPENGYVADPYVRGEGEGWYLDSVAVSTGNVQVQPLVFEATILDNATKRFPVRLSNFGAVTEKARIKVDLDRSTVTGEEARTSAVLEVDPNRTAVGMVDVTLPRDPLALPFRHTMVTVTEGLIDPNQRPTSVFHLNFDPRIWPDLSGTLVEPEDAPLEGVPTILPIQVTNAGRAPARPTTLVVLDTFGDHTQEITTTLEFLPSPTQDPLAATVTKFIPWTPARGTAGVHTIEILLDADNRLEEYTKRDNRIVRQIEVRPLLIPDLAFDERNITLGTTGTPLQVEQSGTIRRFVATAGTLVNLQVPVVNGGTATATDVDVRVFLGSVVLPAKRIARLAPDQSALVSFTFVPQEGVHDLTFEVSSGSRDLDPSDNRAPLAGAISLAASRFNVELPELDPIAIEGPNSEGVVDITLVNRGALGVLLDLEAETPRHLTASFETDQVFLGPGEELVIPLTLAAGPGIDGGDHTVSVVARVVDEPTQTRSLDVVAQLPVEHAIEAALGSETLQPGPGRLRVTFTNDGNLPESLVLVPSVDGGVIGAPIKLVLPRGGTRTVELPVTVPATQAPGDARLEVVAQGSHEATYEFDVVISEIARPVLSADVADASFTPAGTLLPVTIENLGNLPFEGRLDVDPTANLRGAKVLPPGLVVAPGERTEAEIIVPSGQAAALTSVPVRLVDRSGAAQAAATLSLPSARPDASVVRHDLSPPDTAAGEMTTLTVTVGVVGQGRVKDVPVELFIDDRFAARAVVPELVPGRPDRVSFQWPAFGGEHVASVVIDPGAGIPDSDLDNNRITIPVVGIEDASAIARVIEEVREVPGPGAGLMLLLQIALALALARRRPGPQGAERGGRR